MSIVQVNKIQDTTGDDALSFDSSGNTTVEQNLTVDGTTTLTGAVELPDDTVDIADLSATGTASGTTFLRGDNAWAVPSGGKILQIVTGTPDTTARSSTSTTFVTASSTCNVAITPSSTSNKILVIAFAQLHANDGNDGWAATIYRDSTNLGVTEAGLAYGNSVAGITGVHYPTSIHYIDSPSSTSSITYQLYVRVNDKDSDGHSVHIGSTGYGDGSGQVIPAVMYAMEFA